MNAYFDTIVKPVALAAVLAATPVLLAAPAAAQSNPTQRGGFYAEGATHRAPGGMLRLCRQNPSACPELQARLTAARNGARAPAAAAPIAMTSALMSRLRAVNSAVNREIIPRQDRGDEWTLNARYGDCEEYVLTKRQRLIAAGLPRGALRIAVGHTAAGVGHAVLVVRTTGGDLVLDNLTDAILPITQVSHRLAAVQSSERPGRWVHMVRRGGPAPLSRRNVSRRNAARQRIIERRGSRFRHRSSRQRRGVTFGTH